MATMDKNGIFVAQEHDAINPFHSYLNAAFSTVSSAMATLIPSGAVIPFAGTALPEGWYWCDGSNYNRTTDQALFDAIGVTYGNGDGSSGSFTVPDLRHRTLVGSDYGPRAKKSSSYNHQLGKTGGAEDVKLSIDQIPSHMHVQNAVSGPSGKATIRNGPRKYRTIHSSAPKGWGFSGSYSINMTTRAAGGGKSHSNMPPYMALNFIIKR